MSFPSTLITKPFSSLSQRVLFYCSFVDQYNGDMRGMAEPPAESVFSFGLQDSHMALPGGKLKYLMKSRLHVRSVCKKLCVLPFILYEIYLL